MRTLVVLMVVMAGCIADAPTQATEATGVHVIAHNTEILLEPNVWHELDCDPCGMVSLQGSGTVSWYLTWDTTQFANASALLSQSHVTGFGAHRGVIELNGTAAVGVPGNGQFAFKLQGDSVQLLPNLVELVPDEIEFTNPLLAVPGMSCGADETTDSLALRCLRLNNAIGNTGDGPFEVRMTGEEAAQGLVSQTDIRQRIYNQDQTFEDITAGYGQFHATHGHMHVKDLASYNLYSWEDGVQGDAVALGTKQGFCLMDWEPMDFAPQGPESYRGEGCDYTMQDLFMGVSVGWADLYWNTLPGQYIDVTNLADGTYLLAAQVAPFFVESDPYDNRAAVVVSLQGDQVTTHEEFGFHWRLV